jgi:hypothetical protein
MSLPKNHFPNPPAENLLWWVFCIQKKKKKKTPGVDPRGGSAGDFFDKKASRSYAFKLALR